MVVTGAVDRRVQAQEVAVGMHKHQLDAALALATANCCHGVRLVARIQQVDVFGAVEFIKSLAVSCRHVGKHGAVGEDADPLHALVAPRCGKRMRVLAKLERCDERGSLQPKEPRGVVVRAGHRVDRIEGTSIDAD